MKATDVVVEVNGERHRITKYKGDGKACFECSLQSICCEDDFNIFCDMVRHNGFYFKKEA